MVSVNVLPSAPPQEPLYPVLPAADQNFRSQKIDEIDKVLGQEFSHYRVVVKNYKRVKKFRVLRAPVFSQQRFQGRILVLLCLWLACRPHFH